MSRLFYVVVLVLAAANYAYGQATLTVDCAFDLANQKIEFTVGGTLGTGNSPTYLSIDQCTTQVQIVATKAVFDLDTAGADGCVNADWGTYFWVTIQEFQGVRLATDEHWGVLCAYDTSTLTPSVDISVSSVSTQKTTVNYFAPTATMGLYTDAACSVPAGSFAAVGTDLWLCVMLDPVYIRLDGFDLKVKTLRVSSLTSTIGAAPGLAVTENGCISTTHTWFPAWVTDSQGIVKVNFQGFQFTDIVALMDYLIFAADVEVCKFDAGNINCAGYPGCAGGLEYGRKRRDVSNSTVETEEFQLKTTITIANEPSNIPNQNTGSEVPITSTDDVCLQKGGFYGLIVFFVLALLATVLACCYLFTRARKSRKFVDERHLYESGSHNPSYRQ